MTPREATRRSLAPAPADESARGVRSRAHLTAVPDAPLSGRARPLRVCMVHYSPFELDSRVQRQATALAERGDEVDTICFGEPAELRIGPGRVRVHPVPESKQRGGAAAYIGGYARFFVRALRRVSALDRGRHFDLVQVHNMPNFLTGAGIVPKLRGAPLLLDMHDTFPELFASKFGVAEGHPVVRLIRHEERLSAALAD